MTLVKWEPKRTQLDPFRSLRDEVDRLFEDFGRGWPRPWGMAWPSAPETFSPAVDLKETDTEYVVTAEVPGFPKEKLEINVTEDAITIRGERKEEKEKTEGGYHLRESASGSFQRVLALPGSVVADQVKAKLEDGVLTVTLPKAAEKEAKGVKIEVD
jgi:HSP20 family protein